MLYVWSWMRALTTSLHRDEGATMVEYGLIVAVIALVVVAGAILLGNALNGLFSDTATQVGHLPG